MKRQLFVINYGKVKCLRGSATQKRACQPRRSIVQLKKGCVMKPANVDRFTFTCCKTPSGLLLQSLFGKLKGPPPALLRPVAEFMTIDSEWAISSSKNKSPRGDGKFILTCEGNHYSDTYLICDSQ